ncbi:MAG: glucosyl-3-phosphoglycerate synthase [Aeromicrobium sp.]
MTTRDAEDFLTGRTSQAADWPITSLVKPPGTSVSVVIPARNEEATIGDVVAGIRNDLMVEHDLIDELVVMDSLSDDATAERAAEAGAIVHSVADVVPELGVAAGKGEALWKSQFVTQGDVLVFIDADLTDWGTHFVAGLLGPLFAEPEVQLVRGFYDRVMDDGSARQSVEGGRVTELVARPLIALHWPPLRAIVQPLAGEWAIRRSLLSQLAIPVGYGIELSTLIDTYERFGLGALAQVDLGLRAHQHQNLHDLGVMALELLAVAERRLKRDPGETLTFDRFDRTAGWDHRRVPVGERPPASETDT